MVTHQRKNRATSRSQFNSSRDGAFERRGTPGWGTWVSQDDRLRFKLWQIWQPAEPILAWLMLNPSSADHERLDPTLRRVAGFTRDNGFGGFVAVNVFPQRNAKQDRRWIDEAAALQMNGRLIPRALLGCQSCCLAWGAWDWAQAPGWQLATQLARRLPLCWLGQTQSGSPKHPLYLAKSVRLTELPQDKILQPHASKSERPEPRRG